MTAPKTTTINRTWLIKMIIFIAVLLGFGTWGLYDALWVYPANAHLASSYALKKYLDAARDANRLTPGGVKIESPGAELTDLSARQRARAHAKQTGPAERLSPLDQAKLEFLQSLSRGWMLSTTSLRVGQIEKTKTTVGGTEVYSGVGGVTETRKQLLTQTYNPRTGEASYTALDGTNIKVTPDSLQRDLSTLWQGKNPPGSLAAYDVPSQWLFVIVGYGGGLYLIFLILRVARKRFSFESEEKRLILPGGTAFVPAEVKEFDKRKWHKFFVTVNLRDGRSYRLDLLRYVPLEDWVLDMERAAFPDDGADEDTKDEAAPVRGPDADGPGVQAAAPTPS